MKKIISLLLSFMAAFACVFSFAACSDPGTTDNGDPNKIEIDYDYSSAGRDDAATFFAFLASKANDKGMYVGKTFKFHGYFDYAMVGENEAVGIIYVMAPDEDGDAYSMVPMTLYPPESGYEVEGLERNDKIEVVGRFGVDGNNFGYIKAFTIEDLGTSVWDDYEWVDDDDHDHND